MSLLDILRRGMRVSFKHFGEEMRASFRHLMRGCASLLDIWGGGTCLFSQFSERGIRFF